MKKNNGNNNLLIILVIIIFLLLGGSFSLYQKFQSLSLYEQKKNETINIIEKDFRDGEKENNSEKLNEILKNKNQENEFKTGENIIEVTGDIDILKEKRLSSIIGNKEISEKKGAILLEKERIKRKKEAEMKKNIFSGSFCIIGSRDIEKKIFFNSFSYNNKWLVRDYLNKLHVDRIYYSIYCFRNVNINKDFLNQITKYFNFFKNKPDSLKIILVKFLDIFKTKFSNFYRIDIIKKYGMGDMLEYNGCMIGDYKNMKSLLSKIGIYLMGIEQEEFILKYNVNCKVPEIKNYFLLNKDIAVSKYYSELFQNKNIYTKNHGNEKFKKWYKDINYKSGMVKFVGFLNLERLKIYGSNFSYSEDLKTIIELLSYVIINSDLKKNLY